MSPRTGRPTSNPTIGRFEMRTTEEDEKMLDYCCHVTGKKRADIVREGIKEVYNKLKK